MKHFKKIFALLAAMMMALAFVACSGGSGSGDDSSGTNLDSGENSTGSSGSSGTSSTKSNSSETSDDEIITMATLTIKSAADITTIKSLAEATKIVVAYNCTDEDLTNIASAIKAKYQYIYLDLSGTDLETSADFSECTYLIGIKFPDSLKSIANYSFENCTSLESVTIGSGVTEIGSGAFKECIRLSRVTFGKGVTSIGYEAFNGCSKLTSIILPDSLTIIKAWAFRESGLKSITIPKNVACIYNGAFFECNDLISVKFADTNNWAVKGNDYNFDVTNESVNAKNLADTFHEYDWRHNTN